ncbi:MAG: LacI family DNA-binding transcriptional regulator [Tepidisphaeraceae bacterium]
MVKYESICALIEQRIRFGDYAMKELPAEARLASEVGVSRMTARRAILQLVKKGLLIRKPNGRLIVNRQALSSKSQPQIALLMPAFVSAEFELWRASLAHTCTKFEARLRKVDFVHWNDPVIAETLDSFDGVFLLPSSAPVPDAMMERFRESRTPVVSLDCDWTKHGIRSIELCPPVHLRDLLDHLVKLGHERIACLNTQPVDDVIERRLAEIQRWQSDRKMHGRLINEPVKPMDDALTKAHEVVSKFLQARKPDFTAVIATTMYSAVGVMRAFHESGLRVGQDISVCAPCDEGLARYLIPSLTSTQVPDPGPFLEVGLEWMLKIGTGWPSALLLQPNSVSLFRGESTGTCPA